MEGKIKLGLKIILFLGIVAFAFYFAGIASENDAIRNTINKYGYAGIFIVALISGFNLAVPIPAVAFMPLFLQSGLKFWPSIFIIAIGVTMADMAAFYLGRIGREILIASSSESRVLQKLKKIHENYPLAPLGVIFVFACIAPLPNEVLLVPFAFFNYRAIQVFPVLLAGNLIFNSLYSTGLNNLFNLIR